MARTSSGWLAAAALLAIACGKVSDSADVGLAAPSSSASASAASAPTGPTGAAAAATGSSGLSPSAVAQIEELLAEKAARSPRDQKIDSQLLATLRMHRGVPIAPGIERFESNVKVDAGGFVRVEIQTRALGPAHAAIVAAGGSVLGSFPRWQRVTARLPLAGVERVADVPEVVFVEELIKPLLHQDHPGDQIGPLPQGINASSGLVTHQVDVARATLGVRGYGMKIGVLSDSVDHLAFVQASGDLPAVTVLPGQSGVPASGEGTAMLEIVHDLAPDAKLYFATAFGGVGSFAQNILDLRTAGCDVIVDDVFYYNEAAFQDGPIAQAVNLVVADGATYVSSAGNEGALAKGTGGVYEGNFVNSGTSIGAITTASPGGVIHLFDNGTLSANSNLVTAANGTAPFTLFWSDPLGTSNNDYDLFVLDGALSTVVNASTNTQNGFQDPFEATGVSPSVGRRMVVVKKAASAARYLHMNAQRGQIAIATQGQTHGHSAAALAFSVAAAPAGPAIAGGHPVGPFPNPFHSGSTLELFSSDGLRRIFFNANGSLANPGNASLLGDGGVVRQKPDISAADGVPTVTPGFSMFYGTSAAAPHLAAMAALLRGAVPTATASQLRSALTSSAIDIEGSGVDPNSGAGIAMAPAALSALGATAMPALSLGTVVVTAPGGGLDPSESATLLVGLGNSGAVAATSISATLSSSAPGVSITQASSAYPNIGVGGSANNTTAFALSLSAAAACASIPVTLSVTASNRPWAFPFVVDVGSAGPPQTFTFTGVAAIPDGLFDEFPGVQLSVPLTVSGINGTISDVDFKLNGTASSTAVGSTTVGLDHSYVGDLVISLRSPAGTMTTLVDRLNAGAANGNNFYNTTLDDAATNSIQNPSNTNPFTGTFKPNQPLAAFNTQNPNGTWQLRVQDYDNGDSGSVRGFSLIITPRSCEPVLGSPCTVDADCASGACSDGVCCDSQCGDSAPNDCVACSAAGQCGAAPNATVCRAAAGACDVAETCGGATTCPADAAATPGSACGGSPSGDCDAQDTCSGTVGATATCTAKYQASSVVCRIAAGTCDVAEKCTGSSPSCPANVLVAGGATCRASAGPCDVAEHCSGGSAICPSDALANSGSVCRAAVSECDVAETCDGLSVECSADVAVAAGTPCGAAPSGDCDMQDTCSGGLGAMATCVASFQPASVVCRSKAGDCDVAETCTGSAPACPADQLLAAAIVCREAISDCDASETCSGATATCPADVATATDSACSDGSACTVEDSCNGSGTCRAGTAVVCDDGNPCTAEVCDPLIGCVSSNVDDGAVCNDGNACTPTDSCVSGACVGTGGLDCDDHNPCTVDDCRSLEACVHVPAGEGTACEDGSACTVMDSCSADGTCEAGPTLDCDDGKDCTADACDVASGCSHQPEADDGPCASNHGYCAAGECIVPGEPGAGGAEGNAGTGSTSPPDPASEGGAPSAGPQGAAGMDAGAGERPVGPSEGAAGEGGAPALSVTTRHVSGCGCRAVTSSPVSSQLALLGLPLLLLLRRRRRPALTGSGSSTAP